MFSISSCRSGSVSGVFCPKIGVVHPILSSHSVSYQKSSFRRHDCVPLLPRKPKVLGTSIATLSLGVRTVKCASFAERNYQPSVNGDEDPFLTSAVKQAIWDVKSILLFLVEQPSQLKYIEWPGFRSTLKTATLALVLVGMFIIALSSIDSALSYMLTIFLRRKA